MMAKKNLNTGFKMSDLIERIEELEAKEQELISLRNLVYDKLGRFVSAWESGDADQLPTNRQAMINEVRDVLQYVIRKS